MYTKEEQRHLFDRSKSLLQSNEVPTDTVAAANLVVDLRKVIVYHEWRYYSLNDPVISDFEYDQLYKRLEALEKAHPELQSPDSPTQRVSSDLTEEIAQVAHLRPMLSLDNSYDADDLNDFDERIKNYLGLALDTDIEYCVEPKFDGGTIALVFENDRLVRAATRGNGAIGDEITPNIRTVRTVPLRAAFSKHGVSKVELRGEALIRKDVFKKLNEQRAADGLTLFANPRNAATGGLRTKHPQETAARRIEAFVYQLGVAEDENGNSVLRRFNTHDATIELLGSLGFKVPQPPSRGGRGGDGERKVCKNIAEVIAFCNEWQAKREDYPYEIDGMVVKINRLDLQERVGSTGHHPRWGIAFKFQAKQATTKLLSVDFQVGKVGSITPVAVSSVSMHNEDFIRNKDIRLGDTVLVERAGDVIPYIVKPMEELRDGSEEVILFPENCPVCNFPLVRPEDEAIWRCDNPTCEAQVVARLIHHASKHAMDIESLGESTIEKFYKLGWLHSIADIYQLDYEEIAKLEGFGKKSADNLRAAIEKAKKQPIHRFLHSLSIHHLGIKASKSIAAEIDHVMDLKDWDEQRFYQIRDIGPVVTGNVMRFFQNEKNVALLEELEALGVNFRQTADDRPKRVSADAPLAGKTILFTGTLSKMGRKEATEKAESLGAKSMSGVSANLNILVVGEDAGSKLKKAQALGTVQILTEDEFLDLIGEQ